MNEEEKKAIEYYQNKEVSLSVEFDTEKLLKALGITEEDSFKNHQIRFKTLLNIIEKLQKENEDLKAKLEYKEYGDLDNTEFEKYINDIVESKTKELREQLEEEQELNKIIKETRINKALENNIEVKRLREENEELKADNYEANNIIKDLLDNIPVQKVKDKIEELKNNSDYLKQFNDWNEKDYTNEDIINNVLEVLQELLEGSNK